MRQRALSQYLSLDGYFWLPCVSNMAVRFSSYDLLLLYHLRGGAFGALLVIKHTCVCFTTSFLIFRHILNSWYKLIYIVSKCFTSYLCYALMRKQYLISFNCSTWNNIFFVMELINFSLNVPTSSVEKFELEVLKLFNVNGETCSLMLKNEPTRCIDNLGDEYFNYLFSTLNIVDIYLLGRYVAIFNI